MNSEFRLRQVAGRDFPLAVTTTKYDAAVQADRFDRALGGLHVQLLQAGCPMVERAQRSEPARQCPGRRARTGRLVTAKIAALVNTKLLKRASRCVRACECDFKSRIPDCETGGYVQWSVLNWLATALAVAVGVATGNDEGHSGDLWHNFDPRVGPGFACANSCP